MRTKRFIEQFDRDVLWLGAWVLQGNRWMRPAAVQGIGFTPIYGPTVKGRS